jgi:penicillin-binding protein 1A
VTINTAVQNSINTVAVQVLEMMTTQASYDFMVNKLHVSTLVKSYNGHTDIDHSPLGLGGLTDGVSVREMAAAYSIFPNKGIYTEARLYTRILDSDGNVVIENIPESNVAVSEVTSYYMTEALKNVVRSGTGTSAALKGVKGIPVAGKTGTSSGSADRWFTGFTPYYVASIWSGYKTPESMSESINPSSGMFSKVMSLIHEDLEPREFYRPENMRSVTICEDSGLLATDACHDDVRGDHTMTLLVHQSQVPSRLCEAHVWETYCQLTEDTVLEDGTVVEAGRITGLAGPYCPEETLIRRSMLDPSKSTYKVPTPDVGIPYLVGSATTCWVHTSPIVPTPDPVTEYPTADDDNGGGMFYRPSPSPVDPDPYFPTETAPPPLATEMPIF